VAKGMIGGILGDEEEKPEVEAPEALAGVEAFAAAVAAKLAGSDPEVARDTSAFLKKQTQLLEIQAEHLRDEHEARLHFLRGQAREVVIRRIGLRLRVSFQLFRVQRTAPYGPDGPHASERYIFAQRVRQRRFARRGGPGPHCQRQKIKF